MRDRHLIGRGLAAKSSFGSEDQTLVLVFVSDTKVSPSFSSSLMNAALLSRRLSNLAHPQCNPKCRPCLNISKARHPKTERFNIGQSTFFSYNGCNINLGHWQIDEKFGDSPSIDPHLGRPRRRLERAQIFPSQCYLISNCLIIRAYNFLIFVYLLCI